MKIVRSLLAAAASVAGMPVAAFAEESKKGLPQMDSLYYAGELFWLAVSFGALYLLMKHVALPAVHAAQAHRSSLLKGDLTAAKEANEKAQQVMAEYEKALVSARALAHGTMTQSAFDDNVKATAEISAKQHEINRRIADAEKRIAAAKETAMREMQSAIGALSQDIVSKLLRSGKGV